MLKNLIQFYYNLKINKVYNRNFDENGKSPEGVFWNSYYNQTKRFEELYNFLFLIAPNKNISIADVGCGYGAMYEFIKKKNYFYKIKYVGIDINKKFILECKKKYRNEVDFFVGSSPKFLVDFSLMSGTYNLTKTKSTLIWEKYIYFNLKECLGKSRKGLIFNIQNSKITKIKNNIYYADAEKIKSFFLSKKLEVDYFQSENFSNDVIFYIIKKN
jgi:SAM-dependent methyltransferase